MLKVCKHFAALAVLVALSVFADDVVLDSTTEIVIPEKPNYIEAFAAGELAHFLGKAVGKEIAVRRGKSEAKTTVRLGRAAFSDGKIHRDTIKFKSGDGMILIAGCDEEFTESRDFHNLLHHTRDKGTLEGVYTFLEDYVGVRWTEPGPYGEFVPKNDKITVAERDETIAPAYVKRRPYDFDGLGNWTFQDEEFYGGWNGIFQWALRLRASSWKAGLYSGHTPAHMRLKEQFFKSNPDWFALQEDGTRNPRWLCWTHPEVLDMWKRMADAWFRGDKTPEAVIPCLKKWPEVYMSRDSIFLEPYDTYGSHRCRCDRCKAAGCETDKGLNDLIWRSIAEIAQYVQEKWPGKVVGISPYPPHQNIPDFKMPDNVRAIICIPGPEQLAVPQFYPRQQKLIHEWHQYLGGKNKIELYIYMISNKTFGLYPLPLSAAGFTQKYLQEYRGICSGYFVENGAPSQTIQLFEEYALMHLLWNPDLDLAKLREEYSTAQYGPAAKPMMAYMLRLEKDWATTLAKEWPADRTSHPWSPSNNEEKTREAFKNIYTADELKALDALLKEAEALAPSSTIHGKRVARMRKYTYDLMLRERASLLNLPLEGVLKPYVYAGLIDGKPTEADWNAVSWHELMKGDNNKTFQPGKFKLLADKDNLYLRTLFTEPQIADSITPDFKPDDPFATLGNDNAMELFFYSAEHGSPVQILINDKGIAAMLTNFYKDKAKFYDMHGKLDVKVKKNSDSWECEAVIPNSLTHLTRKGDNRFNMIRTRMIKGVPRECTTASPDAVNPYWANPRLYSSLSFNPLATVKYTGQAKPLAHDGDFTAIPFPAQPDGKCYTYVPKGSKSKALYNTDGKGMKTDATLQLPDDNPPGCGWNYPVPCKPGTTILVRLTGIVESKRADAGLAVSFRWQDEKRKPIDWERLGGSACVPAKSTEEVTVTMEMDVPEDLGVAYVIIGVSGSNFWPGIATFKKLEVATFEKK